MKTLKEWADLINGRQYGYELTRKEEEELKDQGFVVVFGDLGDFGNLIHFCGAMTKAFPYEKTERLFIPQISENSEISFKVKDNIPYISSNIPSESFNIYSGGDIMFQGLIFELKKQEKPVEFNQEDVVYYRDAESGLTKAIYLCYFKSIKQHVVITAPFNVVFVKEVFNLEKEVLKHFKGVCNLERIY